MGIENYSSNVLLVRLPKEPQLRHELAAINEIVSKEGGRDVVIDFARVDILTSSSVSNLLILRDMLRRTGCRLILCNAAVPTRCVFRVAGLTDAFEFADDKFAALEAIQVVHN